MKKHLLIFAVFVVLAVLALVLFSLKDTQRIKRAVIKKTAPKKHKRELIETPARKLIPARPEDYGMVVTESQDIPAAQGDWDNIIRGEVRELKSQYPPEVWDNVQKKIREEPSVTLEKIKQIDASIKECRKILEREPENKEVRQRLERLMILRSIGEELPSRK